VEGEVGLDALPAEALHALEQHLAKGGAAELAVGRHLEADALLHGDGFADHPVLQGMQLGCGQPALDMRLARVAQLLRPDQAADMVGAKRRGRTLCHASLLLRTG
jgi:hypothetical protein